MATGESDIGLIGLAVMGQNLALNVADHGFRISVYNRTTATMEKFIAENPETPGGLQGCATLEDFVGSLKRPRRVIVLVKAGKPTDAVIETLLPLLEKGDIIIDGGNAHWLDTIRREKELSEKGLRFIGSGVSGGEEGARFGPSLMPGGDFEAWKEIEPIWKAIAAKVDPDSGRPLTGAAPGRPVEGGVPCTAYIGENGAGHYVKMVHNGIEYGLMQAYAEGFALLRARADFDLDLAGVSRLWEHGSVVRSWLLELTTRALEESPGLEGIAPYVEDSGEGRWAVQEAIDLDVPAPIITQALIQRLRSRTEASFSDRLLAAMRRQFGGHAVRPDSNPAGDEPPA